ncbi:MAG TPA: class III extradiol ring-cleavage dioxygenase [Thermoplasmata archaeon]|nr:class III extradiol ring-cleavage dioxygenase [Thermoplasmata archaeon]
MSLVYGLYAPNAPNLIAPEVFGGAGESTVKALRALDVPGRARPDVILVASPHWASGDGFRVHAGVRPRQIYDFSGFPRSLYEVRYVPLGDPDLARAIVAEGRLRHLPVDATEEWGLDHGAWATLLHVAPDARTPVVPMSIAGLPLEEHLAWGEAIGAAASKTPKRVAFVSTGSMTHRLDRLDLSSEEPWPEAERVEKEIIDLVLAGRFAELADFDPEKWALVAPEGDLGPLFMLAGAIGPRFQPRLVSTERSFGSVSLTVLEFLPH